MNNKIQNPKIEVPKDLEMNDCDILSDILETEKNMSNNLSIALNEASNNELYNKILDIFDGIKEKQRAIFNLMFKYGWYTLEKADQLKIDEKKQELTQKINELQKN